MTFKPVILPISDGGTAATTRLGALTSLGAVGILGSPNVDLKTIATTGLFTVPAGRTAIITDVYVIITASNTVTVPPTLSLGITPTFDEWQGAISLTGFTAVNSYMIFPAGVEIVYSYPTGTVFSVDVTIGATATALNATFYVVGFLI